MHLRCLWHTLDVAKLAFSTYQFSRKVPLIFPITDLTVDLKLICIIGLSDLVNPLISADSYPGWHIYSLWGFFSSFTVSWLLNFTESRCVHLWHLWHYKLHWNYSIHHAQTSLFVNCAGGSMLKPVNWQIYLLMWANFARNWTCHLQRNCIGPHSSSIEDAFWIKIHTLGRQFG